MAGGDGGRNAAAPGARAQGAADRRVWTLMRPCRPADGRRAPLAADQQSGSGWSQCGFERPHPRCATSAPVIERRAPGNGRGACGSAFASPGNGLQLSRSARLDPRSGQTASRVELTASSRLVLTSRVQVPESRSEAPAPRSGLAASRLLALVSQVLAFDRVRQETVSQALLPVSVRRPTASTAL